MNIASQIRAIENRLKDMRPNAKVHFFIGHEEYEAACKEKDIKEGDVVFIDDIS